MGLISLTHGAARAAPLIKLMCILYSQAEEEERKGGETDKQEAPRPFNQSPIRCP